MDILLIIFWVLIAIVFYSYIGYGILIYILSLFSTNKNNTIYIDDEDLPHVTLFVAAYNEKAFIHEKVNNSLALDYPKDKLHLLWVTDGSDDGTPDMLKNYEGITILHQPKREGKIAAINRGMKYVKTPIVVFCDANTYLNRESIKIIASLFANKKVGCVAGEKRIFNKSNDTAAGSGEGFYWKYESFLKKHDANVYSAVGAAGELFAIRTDLYAEVESDTLLDDFIISMRIAGLGYKIAYNPNAYAIEASSASIKEELKRKIRISAGGVQSVLRLTHLLNPFKYGIFSLQYISHKVLRWFVVPFALPIILFVNAIIVYHNPTTLMTTLFYLQILFYLIAVVGILLQNKQIRFKALFIPYYIFIMNYAVYLGFIRFFKGKQSVNWERAKRAETIKTTE